MNIGINQQSVPVLIYGTFTCVYTYVLIVGFKVVAYIMYWQFDDNLNCSCYLENGLFVG